ncbi:MAG: nitroreductase family protein, partial [Actinomycetota bacterium]|nr:nitroreductase family protein [Actinomycetota bacterium]
ILDAGRLAGSAANRQPWTFFVVASRDAVERLSEAVFAPANVLGAALVVAITIRGRGPTAFDAGRAAQNMLLAAWNEGLVSCPNGVSDQERARELLDLGEDERPVIVLSFGYPARAREPERRSPEEWSARANRRPLAELVRRL